MTKIAVIGLGRFGMSLARELGAGGAQVIAIDRNASLVNEIRDIVDIAVKLDSTDETALRSQEVHRVDVCVVAIGENFEAALLTTVIAKRMDIPKVICRAQTAFHSEIFSQIGADEVIQPEMQGGEYLGKRLANDHIDRYIPVADGFTMIELHAPRAFHGKTLLQLELRAKYSINLVGIKRRVILESDGETTEERKLISVPLPDDQIEADDLLVVVGANEALAKLPRE